MSTRFQEVYRSSSNLYLQGSPLLIETAALFKDINTNKVLVLAKLLNISEHTIISCKVTIRAYENNSNELDGVKDFAYLDIQVRPYADFGSKVPIYLPNPITRKFSITVTEVVFDNTEVWASQTEEWASLPSQSTLSQVFSDYEIVKQCKLDLGSDCTYYPLITDGLFLCTCGTINLESSGRCRKCGRKFDTFMSALNEDLLCEHKEARLQKELEEKHRQEQEERLRIEALQAKQKRRKQLAIKISAILIPVIIVAALTPTIIIPTINKTMAYRKATALLNSGSYDLAAAAFEELGEYKDSQEMVSESIYQKAENQYNNGAYEEAIEIWGTLGTYSDSIARIHTTKLDLKEQSYQSALNMISNGEYIEGIETLHNLKGYKDADDLYLSYSYEYACQLIDDGSYKQAIDYFTNASSYKDSDELKTKALYDYGCQMLDWAQYEQAIKIFNRCIEYEDSQEKILYAKMKYVELCGSYWDTKTYDYLTELVAVNYPGAQALYNELYE